MIEAIELTSTRRSRGPGAGPVADVSFDVYPGQVTALLGASGAGKSTVLRMMVELEPAGGGRTLFGGRPFHALRPAVREVGLALNPDAVHPNRTVQAHLQLYAAAGGVPKGRIAEVLEIAGMSTQATVRCGRLEPGRRQRLAIAAALLGDPAALILDEPHGLGTQGMSWFHALIRAYAAQGRTVLVAATDLDSLAGTADHVVVLRRDDETGISRVIASRSAAEVFDERRATVVQVRSPQAARLAAVLETEGARLAPAGPGALQVRGLDRARIGEAAHVAGICLHELSEIGHDDDVFGLRPLPRQKESLPVLHHGEARNAGAGAAWSSGVRLVSTESSVRKTEGAEPAIVPPHTPVAEWQGQTGVPGQAGDGDQSAKTATSGSAAEATDARETLTGQSRAAVLASRAHDDPSQDSVEASRTPTRQSRFAAGAGEANAVLLQASTAADQAPTDQSRVVAEAGQAHADQSQAAEAGRTHVDRSRAADEGQAHAAVAAGQAHADPSQVVDHAGQTRGSWSQAAIAADQMSVRQLRVADDDQAHAAVAAGQAHADPSQAADHAGQTRASWSQAAIAADQMSVRQPRVADDDQANAAVAAGEAHADPSRAVGHAGQAHADRSQAAEAGQAHADRSRAADEGQAHAAVAAGEAHADPSRAADHAGQTRAGWSQAAEAGQAGADWSQPAIAADQMSVRQPRAADEGQAHAVVAAGQAHADPSQAAAETGQARADQRLAAADSGEFQAEASQSQANRSRAITEASQPHTDQVQDATEASRSQSKRPRLSPMAEPIPGASLTTAPTPRAPSEPSTSKRSANRAFATFRRRGKGDETLEPRPRVTIEAISSPSPVQPAVPFTVSPSPVAESGADAEGMTPWRAVTARAVRERQNSVVETASAEQEASA